MTLQLYVSRLPAPFTAMRSTPFHRIRSMREFSLLRSIYAKNHTLSADVLIPPGDDMALLRLPESSGSLLAAVDQVIAGRHFTLGVTPINLIGRKAVARSASDIAAMAAVPLASLASVILPLDFPEADARSLFEAVRITASSLRCPLIGGDMAIASAPLSLSITVLALPGPRTPIRRDSAQPGDLIYVTGSLGGAWRDQRAGRHLTFNPRIDEALALSQQFPVTAMIDLSDGLGRDLDHIAESSGLSATLDASAIPCAPGCSWRAALSDGEDYELCFTAPPHCSLPAEIMGIPITRIGSLEKPSQPAQRRTLIITPDGERLDASDMGWEHRGSHASTP